MGKRRFDEEKKQNVDQTSLLKYLSQILRQEGVRFDGSVDIFRCSFRLALPSFLRYLGGEARK